MYELNKATPVPRIFQTPTHTEYPPGKTIHFEEFFHSFYTTKTHSVSREYLPIFWTMFYVSRNYGQNIDDLQSFLDTLDTSTPYFTVIDYADGILNAVSHLDIQILSSGKLGEHQLPLLTMPCNLGPKKEKKTFASFIGVIQGRHPLRERMRDMLKDKTDYFISESMGHDAFLDKMNDSLFSLCPRGYGPTSFRICEALELNSIPVYIYDHPCRPFPSFFNMEDFCVMIDERQLNDIDNILKSKSLDEINRLKKNGRKIHQEYYSYEGCARNIIKYIK